MFLALYIVKSFPELSNPGQGFAQGQQLSLGVGHVKGVGSGRDTL